MHGRARCLPELATELIDRLREIRHDIASLDDFEASLSGHVRLLQDAPAGLISIERNEVVKVLTVASFVGVRPRARGRHLRIELQKHA